MRFDPVREVMTLREAMDRLLEDSFIRPRGGGPAGGRGGQSLPIDMWETAKEIVVRAPLPGVKPEADDLDVNVHNDVLTIRANLPGAADEESEQARGTGQRWHHREVPRGDVSRTVELPVAVDPEGARAHFGDGMLLLTLPKAQSTQPRRIEVKSAPQSSRSSQAASSTIGSSSGGPASGGSAPDSASTGASSTGASSTGSSSGARTTGARAEPTDA